MPSLTRRSFLHLSAATTAALALPSSAYSLTPPTQTPGKLRLIYFTDTHNQPELSANEGSTLAFKKIRSLKPDLCIQGGDHAMDLNAVPRDRSVMLLDLYQKTEQSLDGIPIHHVIGNHDVFGRDPASNVATSDPLYGKKAFEQRFNTKTYRSFNQQGYHFILLDSIYVTPEREFTAIIDPDQLAWLKTDLAATPLGTPIIVACHVPIVSAAPQYSPAGDKASAATALLAATGLYRFLLGNPVDVIQLLQGHNVIAVLQGHTHINEHVQWLGIDYITSGAVCGNWWHGSRWGTPEGFTVLALSGGKAKWHYETYGWRAVNPQPDPFAPASNPPTA